MTNIGPASDAYSAVGLTTIENLTTGERYRPNQHGDGPWRRIEPSANVRLYWDCMIHAWAEHLRDLTKKAIESRSVLAPHSDLIREHLAREPK